ncbi:hypothetical protein DYU05_01040 [Mucilaginibacter terrenus]|uniref:Bacterial surface antigen (D15) domain-containing protein n=1 Tax=Mucilaginibacter terrenus TaxID=2482727 RepID=A0A3E2NTB2_9SPHI|nr:hypothetical protein [Mucilaginibacter terrenus]RFZ84246.1 hypothetical protein DYU05_01040 [Mucilaginibacter terrenus]
MSYKPILFAAFFFLLADTAFSQMIKGDSVTIAVNPQFDKAGKFKRWLMGTNYRKVWAQPITIPIFHLNKEKGGLRITGTGGGNQTSSLQMVDSSGNEWVLRSVKKSISRDQPKIFKNTLVEDLMVDAGSIGHPYSALCVPPMAEALGIPHSNPKIVYLGDDPQLGKYRKEYANHVYLFEQHGPNNGSKDIKTEKLQDLIEKNNDNKADARLILRARIFDMMVGDWDRHGGQWRWSKPDTTKDIYEPFPTDRDKVFYTTGGAIFNVMSLANPALQRYSPRIRRIDLWNYNTVGFDLYFLNELDQKDWEKEIAFVQKTLSDDLIKRSVKLMPPNVYAVSGPRIIKTFMRRRDRIKKYVMKYYYFLAQRVDVPGSDKSEKFTIDHKKNGNVELTINKVKKDSSIGKVIYQRTFDQKYTRELQVYGLDGKNIFDVTGNTPTKIKTRLVGGTDTDSYYVDSTLNNRHKLLIYDRSDQHNNLPSPSSAHLILKDDTMVNRYKRPENKYNTLSPIVAMGYSTEDGFQIVGGLNYIGYGFHKEPYANKQQLKVNYTLQRSSFIITYHGEFRQVFGSNDLLVNVLERGPRNTNNFFGLGNEVKFDNSGDREFRYYRNRYDYGFADVRIGHRYTNWYLSAGPALQFYTASNGANEDHFFKEYNQTHPEDNVLALKFYTGAIGNATLDTRKNKQFPYNGVVWSTTLTGLTGINVSNHTNAALVSTFSFYLPLADSSIVLANRTGAGTIVGKGEFYQMMNIGGLNMQGYHTSRFIGNTMVYNNTELRAKLFNFNTYVFPSTFGIVAFNDAGRVWLKGESSNTIHDTYGGGIFLTPYNAFLFEGVIGKSPDGSLGYISIGFRF